MARRKKISRVDGKPTIPREHQTDEHEKPNVRPPTPREQLIDEHQAAAELGLSVKTLRRWRWMGVGIPWYKIRGAIRYGPSDLDAAKAAGRVVPETGATPSRRPEAA